LKGSLASRKVETTNKLEGPRIDHHVRERNITREGFRESRRFGRDVKRAREPLLWIGVYEEHTAPKLDKGTSETEGGGGLADPAFVVHNRNSARHTGYPTSKAF
jgi:hypothetical protein